LHDLGKIGVPDAILNKPGKHTPDEWEIMKSHALLGYEMLNKSERRILQAGALLARDHHERWEGGGYPYNKSGDDIHIYGRITAVADVFDALGSDRCYKKAWPVEQYRQGYRHPRRLRGQGLIQRPSSAGARRPPAPDLNKFYAAFSVAGTAKRTSLS
jgi:response regulator RpfG family c-di-GMP phosphodiesterase